MFLPLNPPHSKAIWWSNWVALDHQDCTYRDFSTFRGVISAWPGQAGEDEVIPKLCREKDDMEQGAGMTKCHFLPFEGQQLKP